MISFKMWMLFLLASHYVTNVTVMSSTQNNMQSVCQTKDCRLGQQIASMMDTRVDPCEDMYQFSCGGWIRDNPLPDTTEYLTLIDKLESQNRKEMIQFLESDDVKCLNSTAVEKLRTIFKTCVKTEPNDALLYRSLVNYIDYIGSWTVTPTPGGWNEASWSLQQALEKSHSLWGNSFWTYFISRRILNVRQNGLMNEVQTKTNGNPFDDPAFKEAFMNETVPLALLLGGEEQTARDKLEAVYEFQKNLSKIFRPADLKVQASNITSVKKMTVGEFQTLLGSWIDVDKYFSAVAGQTFVTKDDEMNVIDFDYFKRLGYIIQETDKEVLANYIVYNFVELARSYFPSFMPTNGNSRTEECFELLVTNDLVCPLDSLFVKKHLSPQLHSKVALIVNGLEHQFVKTFENSDWMDSKDKSALISRLKFMDILIGGEDWITDLVKIDQRYEALEAVEGDYLQNRANIVRFRKNKKARSLPEKLVLFSSYHAYLEYEANYNALKLHAGILMEPLASASYPDAYMYGSIGTISGNRIIDGLVRDRHYDYNNGSYEEYFLLNSMDRTLTNRSQCLKDQIDSYQLHGENLSGQLKIDPFIADNGGFTLSYGAYKNAFKSEHTLPNLNLTEDQLFFVGLSQYYCGHYDPEYELNKINDDDHVPDKLRVFNVMANSPEFARAFKCSEKSTLNPEKKCSVW